MEHMVFISVIRDLEKAFPQGLYRARTNEFIACVKGNAYISLDDCRSRIDVLAKVLEWLSRNACYAQPYSAESENKMYRKRIAAGINNFLETDFTQDDFEIIYTRLGNAINHKLTMDFIANGMRMSWLMADKKTGGNYESH